MQLSRRKFVLAGVVLATMPAIACSAREPAAGEAAAAGLAMTIHRDPGCPCCEDWAELARKAGYAVTIADDPQIDARKRRLGVPEDLRSCHTAEVGGYAFEGHVPLADVERLLKSGDRDIAGLAVGGMPLGSPGMETPSGTVQPYQVIAFTSAGGRQVFAEYGRAA